jgi:hypothetical protein
LSLPMMMLPKEIRAVGAPPPYINRRGRVVSARVGVA